MKSKLLTKVFKELNERKSNSDDPVTNQPVTNQSSDWTNYVNYDSLPGVDLDTEKSAVSAVVSDTGKSARSEDELFGSKFLGALVKTVDDYSKKQGFDFSMDLDSAKNISGYKSTPFRGGTKSLNQVKKDYIKTLDKQFAKYKTPDYVTTSSKNAMKPAKYKPRTNTSRFYARGK